MSITTQEGALEALRATATAIGRQVTRYDSGGAAVKAAAATELAGLFAAEAAIYDQLPKLYRRGHGATRWLTAMAALDAAELNRRRAEEWTARAIADQAEADAIERQALPAFADDGMVYVPGRGRIRATGPVIGDSNRKRFTGLDGGQR
jgi:hypothetical protein